MGGVSPDLGAEARPEASLTQLRYGGRRARVTSCPESSGMLSFLHAFNRTFVDWTMFTWMTCRELSATLAKTWRNRPHNRAYSNAHLDELHAIFFCVTALVDNLHLLEDCALAGLPRTCPPFVTRTRRERCTDTNPPRRSSLISSSSFCFCLFSELSSSCRRRLSNPWHARHPSGSQQGGFLGLPWTLLRLPRRRGPSSHCSSPL